MCLLNAMFRSSISLPSSLFAAAVLSCLLLVFPAAQAQLTGIQCSPVVPIDVPR